MKLRNGLGLILSLFLVLPAFAQDEEGANSAFLENWLADFDGSSDKISQLAEAFSDEGYSWRPAEGIRSVSEAIVHVSNANFGLSEALGFVHEGMEPRPENPEADLTAKADVMADLSMSQNHVRGAIKMIMDEDLSGTVSAFGMEMSRYRVLSILAGHSHEHLGQLIAYARSTGVVPPWSGGGGG